MYLEITQRSRGTRAGATLIELIVVVVLVVILILGASATALAMEKSFSDEQVLSVLQLRCQNAMERIVEMASQAVTKDDMFLADVQAGTTAFSLLTFRLIDYIYNGSPVYDDTLKVFIYGDAGGTYPCKGLIIGRGPDLASVYTSGKGNDGALGTIDDNLTVSFGQGLPAVELLISDKYAPRTGRMFVVEPDLGNGLLLKFTLRLNVLGEDGQFVLANDVVLTQTVALRQ
jgi:type II secretory pathway pseudopilin PulG